MIDYITDIMMMEEDVDDKDDDHLEDEDVVEDY